MELAALNSGGAEAFVKAVGGVYELSPWVAERSFASAPFDSVTALHAAMAKTVAAAPEEEQLALVRAHPDLAGKAALAGDLTAESTEEQAAAGLGSLTQAELDKFHQLNGAYKEKFKWPFILAVRNASKSTILGAFESRMDNSLRDELACCLRQIDKIAWMRLLTMIRPNPTGFLTCHVLDTARGCPAAKMPIELRRLPSSRSPTAEGELLGKFVTNDDGRLDGGPALKGEAFVVGTYEWRFFVGDYFARKGDIATPGLPFLDIVPLRFGIDNPEQHYHVPLLCSPFSYSTYRGS